MNLLDCKSLNWQEDETPSTSNPLLNKNMISSTVGIDTGSDGDFQVLRVPAIGAAGDTSSEHSICSDKGVANLKLFVTKNASSKRTSSLCATTQQ